MMTSGRNQSFSARSVRLTVLAAGGGEGQEEHPPVRQKLSATARVGAYDALPASFGRPAPSMYRQHMLLQLLLQLVPFSGAKDIRIGLVMPISNEAAQSLLFQGFLSFTCTAKLAVRHINERDDTIVPALSALTSNLSSINATVYDSGFSASPGIVAYRRLLTDGTQGIVGPTLSSIAQPLAQLGKIDRMPQCSHAASSETLSNKLLYPYCAR